MRGVGRRWFAVGMLLLRGLDCLLIMLLATPVADGITSSGGLVRLSKKR